MSYGQISPAALLCTLLLLVATNIGIATSSALDNIRLVSDDPSSEPLGIGDAIIIDEQPREEDGDNNSPVALLEEQLVPLPAAVEPEDLIVETSKRGRRLRLPARFGKRYTSRLHKFSMKRYRSPARFGKRSRYRSPARFGKRHFDISGGGAYGKRNFNVNSAGAFGKRLFKLSKIGNIGKRGRYRSPARFGKRRFDSGTAWRFGKRDFEEGTAWRFQKH